MREPALSHRGSVTKTTVLRNYVVYYRIVGGRKEETSRKLTSEKRNQTTEKTAATPISETEQANYLNEMGIGAPIKELIESTPSTCVHYLTAEELKGSRLITIWIDEPTPILGGLGANGLTGIPVDAPSDHKAVLIAQTNAPLPPSSTGIAAALQTSFDYRRGGGGVEFTAAIRPTDEKAGGQTRGNGFGLELQNGDKDIVQLKSTDVAPLQSPIRCLGFVISPAADVFCSLGSMTPRPLIPPMPSTRTRTLRGCRSRRAPCPVSQRCPTRHAL